MTEPGPSLSVSPGAAGSWLRPQATLTRRDDVVVIDRRWATVSGSLLTGSLCVGASAEFFLDRIWPDGQMDPSLPFAALAAVYSLAIAYVSIACAVNHTRVSVGDGWLTKTIRPMPWPGRSVELGRGDIVNIRRHHYRAPNGKHSFRNAAHVDVVTTSGKHIRLISKLSPEQAEVLERSVEQRLGIVDDPAHNIGVAPHKSQKPSRTKTRPRASKR